ncbi:MAG: hypothetical protein QN138_05005, partial [Armatimonadota bacterium]|nr:hypothetical protein [Armatimonadota bacterium]
EVVPVESLGPGGGEVGPSRNGLRPLHVRVASSEELFQLADFLQGRSGPREAYAHVVTLRGESVHRLRRGVPADQEFVRELEMLLGEGAVWEE